MLLAHLIHLREKSIATERFETFILRRGLRPVLVRYLRNELGVANVYNPGEKSIPLQI